MSDTTLQNSEEEQGSEPEAEAEEQESPKEITFGERMTQWREKAGLTRKEFSRKLSVSMTAVKNWETDHSTPKLTKYSEIARVLGINVREMGLVDDLDMSRIGDRIKYGRLLRGMSIEAFSYEFGFAIQTVKCWESHSAEVSQPALTRIAKALKIPSSFFDMEKDPHEELAQA